MSKQMIYEQGYCNKSTSIQTNTKETSKGIEGLVLMIKWAKNSLSQMIALAAVQENRSWWKLWFIFDHKTRGRICSLFSLWNLKFSCSENV